MRDSSSSAEQYLHVAFLLLLLWIPIPLGSNTPSAWMVLEVAAFALMLAWMVLWVVGKATPPDWIAKAWPAFGLLAVWLILQALYVIPLPVSWVEALSPEAARVQATVADIGISRDRATLSIDPNASRVSFLKSLAYVVVFVLTILLANRRSRVLALVRVLVYGAVVHAIYAVLMHLSQAEHEWFKAVLRHSGSAIGFYVNRNHFAGYLEMTSALGIGLLIAGLSDRRADSWKKFFRHTLEWVLSPKMILRLSLCILVIALTTTHSRMGNTAFFASLLVAGVIGVALSKKATRNTVVLLTSLVVLDLFIVGSWFGVEKLAQRIEQTTMQDVRTREEPARYTVPIIQDYPLLGAGPGSFYVAFPKYRPESVVSFYDYAHNDYAQFAAESGLVGFALLGLFVVSTLVAALVAQWQRRDPLMRGMSFACVMGVTAILIHSWVDFNLQIPANASYFMVLLALGWISLYHDRHQTPGIANLRVDR